MLKISFTYIMIAQPHECNIVSEKWLRLTPGTILQNKYRVENQLGTGTSGVVYRAKNVNNNSEVALKTMHYCNLEYRQAFLAEVEAYRILSLYPNCYEYIVCLHEYFTLDLSQKYGAGISIAVLVQEYMDKGSMEDKVITRGEIAYFFRDCLKALEYIHKHGLAHQDIKPANILRKGDVFKFGDLGLVCSDKHIVSCDGYKGSFPFMPPERDQKFKGLKNAQKHDIWSLGVTFYGLITGNFPFKHTNALQQYVGDQSGIISLNLGEGSGFVPASVINGIVNSMLRVNPQERPSAKQLLDILETAMKGCAVGDDVISRDQVLSLLNKWHVQHSPTSSTNDLCTLLKDSVCEIDNKNWNEGDLRSIVEIFGIKEGGNKAALCKTVRQAIKEQIKIDKHMYTERLLHAIYLLSEAEYDRNMANIEKVNTLVKLILSTDIGKKNIDVGYLKSRLLNAQQAYHTLYANPNKTLQQVREMHILEVFGKKVTLFGLNV
jgi:serine/threonine protein kinase